MAKTKISEFSATPGNNTDIDGINIAEGCAPSGINDAIRELMSQLKDFQTGAAGDSFNGPIGSTTPAAGAFTTLTSNGATTLGDAVGDVITINGTVTYANANPTYSAGTANGVGYLNGSKQFTTGSALTFDGSQLGVGTASGTSNGLKLNAGNSGANYVLYRDGTTGLLQIYGNQSGFNGLLVSGVDGQQYLSDPAKHVWSVSNSEQMRLTSTGLGIGTSSPGEKLEVKASSAMVKINSTASFAQLGYYNNGSLLWNAYADISSSEYRLGNSGGTQLTLTSSGNLGLGVTPSAWGSAYKAMQIGSLSGMSLMGYSGAAEFGNNFYFDTAYRYAASTSASRYTQSGGAHAWYNAPSGTAGNAISFTQAMTLDASGNFVVGANVVGAFQNVNSFYVLPGDAYAGVSHVNGTASGTAYLNFSYNAGIIGSITQSGTTAVLYNITSDQRLKENIVDAPEFGSVIDSIKVRSYDWKADGNHQRAGFVAQELVTVAPEAVHQPADPEEMMAVDYSKLVPMLVKEIQSLRKRLAAAGIA